MMAEGGLDLRTWLAVVGVFVLFFGVPAASIAFDVRKKRREQENETGTEVRRPPAPRSS